ncbi:MAG: nitrilotriacetate monooxygenase [Pseudomonadales bacterium]|nr:nitrilotriacetate monooxygenase [Pseudomonadales bacterium]RLU03396.1 MAG: flavin reductase [Ketobacter sp.]
MTQIQSQTDPKAFRSALGQFATGVTVVTTLDSQGNKIGMTANSFSSVSLEPMLVLWSIARTSNAFDDFIKADRFAIHVLNSEQQAVSNQFASKCQDRFCNVEHGEGLGGVPLLKDYSAVFQCQTEHQYDGGDHVIIVGRVLEFDNRGLPPLIFHAGRYADLELPVAV